MPTAAPKYEYGDVLNPAGYVNNGEITLLDGNFLVKGSINTVIKKGPTAKVGKVMWRGGTTLIGAPMTVSNGMDGSCDWLTSSAGKISLRSYPNNLEIFHAGAWVTLLQGFGNRSKMQFTTWWDNVEKLDKLLFCNGTNQVGEWSGGITTIASVSSSTLTKAGYMSVSTLTFNKAAGTIVDSSAGFLTALFKAGDVITITGSASNDDVYTIYTVTANTIVVGEVGSLTDEASGASIILQYENGGTWDGARFLVGGMTLYSASTIAFVAGTADTITDSANGFLQKGFYVGQSITVTGSSHAGNNRPFTIVTIAQGTLTLNTNNVLTDESAGTVFTLSTSRGVTIDGNNFYYTGGETTGTLTGLILNPTGIVNPGDLAIQTVRWNRPVFLATTEIDLIEQYQNYVFYGSNSSQTVNMSESNDFTQDIQNSPRIPGDGAQFNLTAAPTAFAPTEGNMWISCGKDDWFEIVFTQTTTSQTAGDLTVSVVTETVTTTKLKTSPGEAAVGQGAVFRVRDGVSFLSFEKAIEQLLQLQVVPRPTAAPISDDIKDDLDSYDVTGAQGVYFERNLWITLPAEGLVIIFNYQYGFWHPPQQGFFTRLAVIEINGVEKMCGHSGAVNETYILDFFDGLDGNRRDGFNPASQSSDNGAPINHVAAFGYQNYGMRFWQKGFSRLAAELILGLSTTVTDEIVYDYQGARGIRIFNISSSDPLLTFGQSSSAAIGQNPIGYFPIGNYLGDGSNTVKTKVIWTTPFNNFFETQRIFSSSSIDDYAEILGYGANVQKSDNEPVAIIR